MKMGKRTIVSFSLAAMTASAVAYSTAALAADAYCSKLGNSWGDWLDWVAMCM